jgi:prepilin peptidase CpaA
MPVPIDAAVAAFIAACIATDIRTRRIPNVLSGAAILTGAALNTVYFGTTGLLGSLAGLLLPIAILLFPFALGGVGGGDVKMMGAVGALLGPSLALTSLCVGVIFGGVIMAAHLAYRGRLREKLAAMRGMVTGVVVTRSLRSLHVRAEDPGAVALPYSVPLGLGTITVLAFAGPLGLW